MCIDTRNTTDMCTHTRQPTNYEYIIDNQPPCENNIMTSVNIIYNPPPCPYIIENTPTFSFILDNKITCAYILEYQQTSVYMIDQPTYSVYYKLRNQRRQPHR